MKLTNSFSRVAACAFLTLGTSLSLLPLASILSLSPLMINHTQAATHKEPIKVTINNGKELLSFCKFSAYVADAFDEDLMTADNGYQYFPTTKEQIENNFQYYKKDYLSIFDKKTLESLKGRMVQWATKGPKKNQLGKAYYYNPNQPIILKGRIRDHQIKFLTRNQAGWHIYSLDFGNNINLSLYTRNYHGEFFQNIDDDVFTAFFKNEYPGMCSLLLN